jgi:hypothetical protein
MQVLNIQSPSRLPGARESRPVRYARKRHGERHSICVPLVSLGRLICTETDNRQGGWPKVSSQIRGRLITCSARGLLVQQQSSRVRSTRDLEPSNGRRRRSCSRAHSFSVHQSAIHVFTHFSNRRNRLLFQRAPVHKWTNGSRNRWGGVSTCNSFDCDQKSPGRQPLRAEAVAEFLSVSAHILGFYA